MRACHNCGYLVPDAWDTCKRCHAALKDRVPAGAGARRATPYSPLTAPKPAAPKAATVAVAAPTVPVETEPPAPRPIVGLPTRAPAPPLVTQAPGSPAGYDANFAAPVRLGEGGGKMRRCHSRVRV